MKVILDIEDSVLADMQMYADVMQKELPELIQQMFIRYIKEPKQMIYDVYNEDGNSVELMQALLFSYLTEYLEDLQDKQMIEVFKTIRDDIIDEDRVIAKLYKVYKAAK